MLTEEQLISLPDQTQYLYRELENDITNRMFKRVGQIAETEPDDTYKLTQLSDINYDLEYIFKKTIATVDKSNTLVYNALKIAALMDYMSYRTIYKKIKKPWVDFDDNEKMQNILNSTVYATNAAILNSVKNAGFVNAYNAQHIIRKGGIWQDDLTFYSSLIKEATYQIRAGDKAFYGAMNNVVKTLAEHGMCTFNTDSGRTERIDTAARRHLLGAQAEIQRKQAEMIGADIGADGMEITYHSSPRPSHAFMGGKQFTMKRYLDDVLPLLEEPNCYHRAFPIILGVSAPAYSAQELKKLHNQDAKTVVYNGKNMTTYDLTQRQRYYELSARKWKDRTNIYRAMGDKENERLSRAHVRAIMHKYSDFSASVGLPTYKNRATVPGYK